MNRVNFQGSIRRGCGVVMVLVLAVGASQAIARPEGSGKSGGGKKQKDIEVKKKVEVTQSGPSSNPITITNPPNTSIGALTIRDSGNISIIGSGGGAIDMMAGGSISTGDDLFLSVLYDLIYNSNNNPPAKNEPEKADSKKAGRGKTVNSKRGGGSVKSEELLIQSTPVQSLIQYAQPQYYTPAYTSDYGAIVHFFSDNSISMGSDSISIGSDLMMGSGTLTLSGSVSSFGGSVVTMNSVTYSGAFSSAFVPEPGTVALLGLGAVAMLRRCSAQV